MLTSRNNHFTQDMLVIIKKQKRVFLFLYTMSHFYIHIYIYLFNEKATMVSYYLDPGDEKHMFCTISQQLRRITKMVIDNRFAMEAYLMSMKWDFVP